MDFDADFRTLCLKGGVTGLFFPMNVPLGTDGWKRMVECGLDEEGKGEFTLGNPLKPDFTLTEVDGEDLYLIRDPRGESGDPTEVMCVEEDEERARTTRSSLENEVAREYCLEACGNFVFEAKDEERLMIFPYPVDHRGKAIADLSLETQMRYFADLERLFVRDVDGLLYSGFLCYSDPDKGCDARPKLYPMSAVFQFGKGTVPVYSPDMTDFNFDSGSLYTTTSPTLPRSLNEKVKQEFLRPDTDAYLRALEAAPVVLSPTRMELCIMGAVESKKDKDDRYDVRYIGPNSFKLNFDSTKTESELEAMGNVKLFGFLDVIDEGGKRRQMIPTGEFGFSQVPPIVGGSLLDVEDIPDCPETISFDCDVREVVDLAWQRILDGETCNRGSEGGHLWPYHLSDPLEGCVLTRGEEGELDVVREGEKRVVLMEYMPDGNRCVKKKYNLPFSPNCPIGPKLNRSVYNTFRYQLELMLSKDKHDPNCNRGLKNGVKDCLEQDRRGTTQVTNIFISGSFLKNPACCTLVPTNTPRDFRDVKNAARAVVYDFLRLEELSKIYAPGLGLETGEIVLNPAVLNTAFVAEGTKMESMGPHIIMVMAAGILMELKYTEHVAVNMCKAGRRACPAPLDNNDTVKCWRAASDYVTFFREEMKKKVNYVPDSAMLLCYVKSVFFKRALSPDLLACVRSLFAHVYVFFVLAENHFKRPVVLAAHHRYEGEPVNPERNLEGKVVRQMVRMFSNYFKSCTTLMEKCKCMMYVNHVVNK